LNVPTPLPQTVKTQLISDLGRVHRIWEILFICEDEEKGVTEFVFIEHALEFFTGLGDTLAIVGINNEDNALSVLEV
jgi:hypothetical protein